MHPPGNQIISLEYSIHWGIVFFGSIRIDIARDFSKHVLGACEYRCCVSEKRQGGGQYKGDRRDMTVGCSAAEVKTVRLQRNSM